MAWLTTLLALAALLQLQAVVADNPEKQLLKDLMNKYGAVDRIVRPARNLSDTVLVKYGMGVVNIQEFDEDEQTLTITSWARYLWMDARLTWDPQDYGGITTLNVPASTVWRPDITLYNRFDMSPISNDDDYLVLIYNSGDILWIPPQRLKVYCEADTKQRYDCTFKFGSWTYDGFKVDLAFYEGLNQVDMSDFQVHHKWEIVDTSADREVKYYDCCEEPYPSLTFKLVISRK